MNSSEEQCSSIPCLICHYDSHGTHFGAQSCRACAAFFRRTVVNGLKYLCKKGSLVCEARNGKFRCRSCRYKKCVSVGMIPDNVQLNRESPIISKKPQLEEKVDRKRLQPGWRRTVSERPLYNISGSLQDIKKIFSEFELPTDPEYINGNTLTKLEWALRNHRRGFKKETLVIVKRTNIDHLMEVFVGWMKTAARLLMHVEPFRNASCEKKFASLLSIWQIWNRLEKLQLTIEIFGRRTVDEKIIVASELEVLDFRRLRADMSRITTRSQKELRAMFLPFINRMFDEVAQPLLELRPTVMELCFMLVHLCYDFQEKRDRLHNHQVASNFMNTVSDDLHEYYHNNMKMRNYAGRLIKLTRIVQRMESVFRDRRKALDLAKLFDVFKRKISEPCIFG